MPGLLPLQCHKAAVSGPSPWRRGLPKRRQSHRRWGCPGHRCRRGRAGPRGCQPAAYYGQCHGIQKAVGQMKVKRVLCFFLMGGGYTTQFCGEYC